MINTTELKAEARKNLEREKLIENGGFDILNAEMKEMAAAMQLSIASQSEMIDELIELRNLRKFLLKKMVDMGFDNPELRRPIEETQEEHNPEIDKELNQITAYRLASLYDLCESQSSDFVKTISPAFPHNIPVEIVFFLIKELREESEREKLLALEKAKLKPRFVKENSKKQDWGFYKSEFQKLISEGKTNAIARRLIGNMIERKNKDRISKGLPLICTQSRKLRPSDATLRRQLVTAPKNDTL